MSEKTYITLTQDEKAKLNEYISQEYGSNRISQGCVIRLLAEEKL